MGRRKGGRACPYQGLVHLPPAAAYKAKGGRGLPRPGHPKRAGESNHKKNRGLHWEAAPLQPGLTWLHIAISWSEVEGKDTEIEGHSQPQGARPRVGQVSKSQL
jgi:hypothetical protein